MSCTREAIEIVSLLSVESIFFSPQDQREHASEMKKKFISPFGDLITFLNVLRSYEVQKGNSEWCYQNFINRRNMKHVIVSIILSCKFLNKMNHFIDFFLKKNLQ
jgi:HrpA-like RNA helicase